MQHIIHQLQKEKKLRLLTSIIMIVFSAFMQCYIMNVFMAPCNLISGGFTGLALLINKVCALVNINFPTQVGIIALNVPAAILCYKHISPRFTFLSCVQFFQKKIISEQRQPVHCICVQLRSVIWKILHSAYCVH